MAHFPLRSAVGKNRTINTVDWLWTCEQYSVLFSWEYIIGRASFIGRILNHLLILSVLHFLSFLRPRMVAFSISYRLVLQSLFCPEHYFETI